MLDAREGTRHYLCDHGASTRRLENKSFGPTPFLWGVCVCVCVCVCVSPLLAVRTRTSRVKIFSICYVL